MSRSLKYTNIKFFYLCHDSFLLSSVSSGNVFPFLFLMRCLCVCCFVSFLLTPTTLSQLHWFYNPSVYCMLLPFLVSYLYFRLFNFSFFLFVSFFLIFLYSTEWSYDCAWWIITDMEERSKRILRYHLTTFSKTNNIPCWNKRTPGLKSNRSAHSAN